MNAFMEKITRKWLGSKKRGRGRCLKASKVFLVHMMGKRNQSLQEERLKRFKEGEKEAVGHGRKTIVGRE